MVETLVARLLEFSEVAQVLLTRNRPEMLTLPDDARLRVLDNPAPKGFGANHNVAFQRCDMPFFCVLNPDIVLSVNPFPALFGCLAETGAVVAAPRMLAPDGAVADSARRFPTLARLVRKGILGDRGLHVDASQAPDWVAGMFMLWRSEAFAALGGFDEGYFLYYEDVDICARAWKAGLRVAFCPEVSAIHDARRESHRSLRFLRWHLASMTRYFLKHGGRQPWQHD
jgi:hypothetical protein